MDHHHVAGRSNHRSTIQVPANSHRAILTPDMYDWPKKTRENPTSSPLLIAAACIRGFCNIVSYLIDELIYWIAELLEALHEELAREFGDNY